MVDVRKTGEVKAPLKVPVYIVSSVAEELLAFLNIIPEWLSKQRQEKLFAGELLFAHVQLLNEKKIHVVPTIHSHKLLLQKIQPLLQTLQPKNVLFPEDLRLRINFRSEKPFSVLQYTEAETLKVSCRKNSPELKIATDLASQFYRITFKNQEIIISRLKGELLLENARYYLLPDNDTEHSLSNVPLLHWGLPDSEKLLAALSEVGINASLQTISDAESKTVCIVHSQDPCKALIITTADENVASLIYKVLDNILHGV